MSITPGELRKGNATLGDCVRLWTTLTIDYIPSLRVELVPDVTDRGEQVITVELVDYATLAEKDPPHRSVWSRRVFQSPLYLISYNQLFDLLISGYRTIEQYFSTGIDNRPPCSKG
jgi:hypothetical protein